jgi:hypothetical protein
MCNRMDETSLASLVREGNAQSLIRILDGCVSFMLEQSCGDDIFRCVYRNGRLFENDKVMGRSFNTRQPCP